MPKKVQLNLWVYPETAQWVRSHTKVTPMNVSQCGQQALDMWIEMMRKRELGGTHPETGESLNKPAGEDWPTFEKIDVKTGRPEGS